MSLPQPQPLELDQFAPDPKESKFSDRGSPRAPSSTTTTPKTNRKTIAGAGPTHHHHKSSQFDFTKNLNALSAQYNATHGGKMQSTRHVRVSTLMTDDLFFVC